MRRLRSISLVAFAGLALAVAAGHASAQSIGCNGKNLLDDLKTKDAAAYARIRAVADTVKNGKTLLWKIESEEQPDHPASYLYGTLPVTDERLKPLTPAVEAALSVSSRIATGVEDMSSDRTQEALTVVKDVLLPGAGTQLGTLLAPAEATRAAALLAHTDLPKALQPRVRPWVASLMLTRSSCERRRLREGKITQDAALAAEAENRGIGTFGLEPVEMEMQALAAIPDAEAVSLLRASLAAQDLIDDQTETQVQLYLAHDVGALWPLYQHVSQTLGADPQALQAYQHSVFEVRNTRMRDRALMHLATGGVFIAVDALYLPGDTGLVELLRDAGYTLTAVE